MERGWRRRRRRRWRRRRSRKYIVSWSFLSLRHGRAKGSGGGWWRGKCLSVGCQRASQSLRATHARHKSPPAHLNHPGFPSVSSPLAANFEQRGAAPSYTDSCKLAPRLSPTRQDAGLLEDSELPPISAYLKRLLAASGISNPSSGLFAR